MTLALRWTHCGTQFVDGQFWRWTQIAGVEELLLCFSDIAGMLPGKDPSFVFGGSLIGFLLV